MSYDEITPKEVESTKRSNKKLNEYVPKEPIQELTLEEEVDFWVYELNCDGIIIMPEHRERIKRTLEKCRLEELRAIR